MAHYTTNWHGPASVSNDMSDLKGEYLSANPNRLAWKRSSDDSTSEAALTSALQGVEDEEAHFAVTSHVNSPSGNPDRTAFLRFQSFKFNIPSAATIVGVQVKWTGVSVGVAATGGSPPTSGDEMCDDRVYLVIDGSYYLSDNAGLDPDADSWSVDPDGDSDIEELDEELRGGSTSLFGFSQTQITPAKINSPQFGFVFSAKNRYENEESGTHTYPALENARIKVWYDLAEDTNTLKSSILCFWTGTLDSTISSYPLWYGESTNINDAAADTADSSLSYKQLSSTDLTPNMHFGDRGEFDESATGRTPSTVAPVTADATYTLPESTVAGSFLTVSGTDANDDDTLTYSITAGNGAGKFSINSSTGVLSTLGGLDFETTSQYVLTIKVEDDGGLYDSATVTVDISDVNEAPVAIDDTFSIAENSTSLIGTVSASDVDDGDVLTYSITAGDPSDQFSIGASNGELVATGSGLDFEDDTQHVLTITVSDSALTDTATITVNVTNVNEAPVVADQTFSPNENELIVGTVSATDPEGDTLTYSITADDSGGIFSINASTGQITTTGLDYEDDSEHILTVKVEDNSGLFNTATITVDVGDVNDPPYVTSETFAINENSIATVGTVAATDDDGHTLTYSITAGNSGGEFSIGSSSGTISTVSELDHETEDQYVLTVTVTDSVGASTTGTITINVTDVNEAPVAVDNAFTEVETNGVQVLGTIAASDVDTGDTLTYSITAGNGDSLFSINSSTGSLSTTGDLDYDTASQHVLTITVTDDGTGALSDTATVTVDVTAARAYTGVPTKQYVFDSEQTSSSQSLSMSDSDWSYPDEPDLSEFGMLARVTLAEEVTSGERHIWADYESGTTTGFYFGRVHSNGRLYCRLSVSSGSVGQVYTGTDFGAYLANGNETLLYWYLIDGDMKLFAGQGDDPLTLQMTDSDVGVPNEGTGKIVFGARTLTAWGWYGTIHQPMMFTANYGVDIPDETEVGTADNPVDLSGHGALFSSPNADNAYPNIDLWHPQAWTDNNSIEVETRS